MYGSVTVLFLRRLAMSIPSDDVFIALQRALAGEYSLGRELGSGGTGIAAQREAEDALR